MRNKLLSFFVFAVGILQAQAIQQVLPNPDCQIFFTLTASGTNSAVQDNRQQGCTSWNMAYVNSGFSGVTVTLQSAANNAGVPGSYGTGFPVQQTVISGSNPGTSTTAGFVWLTGTNAFARVHLVATGSGVVNGALFGWRIPNAASQGGGGGGITCLTGDVAAGSGSGCTTATVQGIETVPFCSGYSPTNGQFVQYTTGSSPNPCYTAATSSGGGQGASVVTYTPGASVTLTCPSSTLDNVTVFDPGGTALSANMAVTFASCTTGQIVILRVIQAASGGPYTVTGIPTGSPSPSTYPSAGTIYTLQASSSSAMNFVNVAANAGASSLGSGANGISRTVMAGSGGVTVNLLAAKDASNPTLYVLPASGGCGSGVAGYSATATNVFELYTVPGTVLTMVADGTITAGHILTGGSSTPGRVADTGQTARTAVANGTCIVGVALASATVGNTVLVAYDGTGVYGAGAASSVAWNAITNPTGNQSLAMGSNTTTWTFGATTGSGVNMVTVTDTASNTGTGFLMHLTTASGSAAAPWEADANGTGCNVSTSGVFICTGQALVGAASASPAFLSGEVLRVTGTSGSTIYFTVQNQTLGAPMGVSFLNSGNVTVGRIFSISDTFGLNFSENGSDLTMNISGSGVVAGSADYFAWAASGFANTAVDTTLCRSAAGVVEVGSSTGCASSGTVLGAGLIATAAASTVGAGQVGYGATTAAATNCISLATACLVINVAGTTRYIPYY